MHNNYSISTPRIVRIHRASTRTTRPHSCALSRYEHAVASYLDLVLLVQFLTVFLPFAVCFNQLKQQQNARVCLDAIYPSCRQVEGMNWLYNARGRTKLGKEGQTSLISHRSCGERLCSGQCVCVTTASAHRFHESHFVCSDAIKEYIRLLVRVRMFHAWAKEILENT